MTPEDVKDGMKVYTYDGKIGVVNKECDFEPANGKEFCVNVYDGDRWMGAFHYNADELRRPKHDDEG